MVEITLPIVLQIIQTVSISVGIIYYLFIMRNVQKSAQRENLLLRFQSFDKTYNMAREDFNEQEWGNTMEDFWNHSSESRANFNYLHMRFNNLGVVLKEKMMDPDIFYQLFPPMQTMSIWERIENIIKDYRKRTNDTTYNEAFEYLYNETKKRYPDISTLRDYAAK